jgi:hypothetical protein
MLLLLIANIKLEGDFYRVVLILHLLFYAVAITGLCGSIKKHSLISIPTGFLFLNIAAVQGLWAYLRGHYSNGWK